jgi:hypothetical protein
MKILFLHNSSFDSLGKQAINVLRIDFASLNEHLNELNESR